MRASDRNSRGYNKKHIVLECDNFLTLFEWLMNSKSVESIKRYEIGSDEVLVVTFRNNRYISFNKMKKLGIRLSNYSYVRMKKEPVLDEWVNDEGSLIRTPIHVSL